MLRNWFVATIALVLMVVLFAGCGGIPQDKYNAAVADLGNAQKQIETAKSDLQTSAAKVAELTSSQEKIKTELVAAQAKNVELSANLTSKQAELASAQAANTALKQDNDSQKTRISSLEKRILFVNMTTYTDNDKGFSINFPADWEKQTLQNTLVYYVGRGIPVNSLVMNEALPQVISAQAYFDKAKQSILNSGYTYITSKEVSINQMAAIRGIFTKNEVSQMIVTLVKGTTGWGIVCTCRSNELIDYAMTFNDIMYSFKLTK